MFGPSDRARLRGYSVRVVPVLVVLTNCLPLAGQSPMLPQVKRVEMIETAKAMAEFKWVAATPNLKAPCIKNYRSRFREGQPVSGVAYDWGGMDEVAAFEKKLKESQAAGSHQEEGVSDCTAGVDCSGFVSLCWRQKMKFGTATIGKIAPTLQNINIFTDLKPGDALNKPGSHIVMFAAYNPDGTIDVYEASGSASRVVLSRRNTWVKFRGYVPIRYGATVE
jgi:hypothetical protein